MRISQSMFKIATFLNMLIKFNVLGIAVGNTKRARLFRADTYNFNGIFYLKDSTVV